ncbi:retrovirus-related pol polyprotein from transposon TNT 1-94 [Tanacetum coccineum]|uniref:Retrovirus-related pol polyprotein from transposon TNT 1-94 n=1 Tax=Tanacetum coccineum TaxID=301880 RepID=A0ABQ5EJE6_9ASTR
MMKGSDIGIQEKKAKLFNEWERFTSTDGGSIESYYHHFSKLMNDFKRNKYFPEKIASNLKCLNNLQPEWRRHVTIVHQTKDLHTTDYTQLYDFLKYNQKEVDELRAERLGKPHDPLALVVTSKYPVFHQDQPSLSTYIQQPLPNNNYNPQPSFTMDFMQQPMPNPKDISDPTTTMNMALTLMAKAFKLNYLTPTNNNQRISSNPRNRQIAQPRGYNCMWISHLARNCTARPRRRDAAYLQTQLLITQKEVGIQLQAEEFDFMAAAGDLDEIEEVDANCILMANLQQASSSGTQTDKAPVYESDGLAEVHNYNNCYDNEIFNMFTQEEQYTDLLEPIPEPHLAQQNDNNVISDVPCVEHDGGMVEQCHASDEETRALYDSLYNNLAIEVEKVNSVNRNLKATNAELTTKLARYKNQEKCKQITALNEEISNLNKQLSMEKSNVSSLLEEKKKLKSDFKIREDELLDKQILLENKIKELDNILVKMGSTDFKKQQSFYNGKVLLEKHDPPVVYDSEETLQLAQESQAAKFVRDFKSLANEADESLDKQKTSRSCRILSSFNGLDRTKERFENCIIKKENEYAKLWNDWYKKCEECKYDKISYDKAYNDMHQKIERLQAQLGDLKGKSTSVNTLFAKQSILGKPPFSSKSNLYSVTPFPKSSVLPNVDKTNALSKLVTLNSIPTPQESKVVKDVKVISPGMFRINPSKTSREDKFVPINKVRVSVRTNPTTVSQPHVITKKEVNSDSNGLSSTGVNNTAKTRRPQPRSNTKNDRVTSVSKSSCSKNKEIEVEEHHRNLLLSKKMKHMSSECNNVKLAIQNVKSKVVCAMCKQCLISANHDACVLNYVNDMNSRGKKQKPKVWKPKNVGSNVRLASPKPRKPRTYLRWSPTGRIFDLTGKIIESSNVESHSDCSNGDNACTSNPQEPKSKRFPNSTFSLAGHSNLFMFLGTIRFGNDHVAAILGFGDLQWGNILITRVYFIGGLGHNLFSVRQFCDLDLEPLYLQFASWLELCLPSPLVKASTFTLRHFDTINDLARNDLITGLPKFKYHKEHLCPSCEQGKSKRVSHPPKPVPNSKKRLHLLHMDLCGPMRIASINGKWYVLVIVDDYSRYTWVHFFRSKDDAPEVIKTFLKRITVLLQAPVIIVRTDNGTEFKNQAEAIATACYTQNRSIIHCRFNKTPYELINGRKLDISFLHVFGALCYPKNDREDIRKLGAKGDIGFFIGYSAESYAYIVYNQRTKKIMETMNVTFDELSVMAFK